MRPIFSCRIDTTNFMKAQAIIRQHSRQKPAEGLNRAVAHVVREAQKNTPLTSTGRIDTKLQVTTNPVISKKWKITKKSVIGVRQHKLAKGSQGPKFVPLAALIIQAQVLRVDNAARSQPGMSRINRMTSGRYARMSSPFRGVSRRTGAAKMRAAISRMVKAGHSSVGFFKQSWTGILKALNPKGGGPPTDNTIGIASPATPGTAVATCVIENRLGMDGRWPALDARRNAAAHRILAPALQNAINSEFHKSMELIDKKGWNEAKPTLAQLGFVVTT